MVPASWPPDFLDDAALVFTRDRVRDHPEEHGWWMHFVVQGGARGERVLVGAQGVLEKCGFRHVGAGSETGVIRYELKRPTTGAASGSDALGNERA